MNLAILQARMSSTRMPNKVLKKINGKELLKYECERLSKSKKIDKLIIATSTDISDNEIEKFSLKNDIEIYRGSLDDVLERYFQCAKRYKEKNNIESLNIIRVTGDCPIIDVNVVDEVIEVFENGNYDYVSNTLMPTYPDGMDVEICTYEALANAHYNATYSSDREHVTLYIKKSEKFTKHNVASIYDFSHLRMTVDEQNDFELIKMILENLYEENPNFSYLDAIVFMSKNPDTFYINSEIMRDEGLKKSLENDGRI